MKLITRDTDYAMMAVCCIAKNKNNVTPVSDLVKQLNIPRAFLRKILQILNRAGILNSYKGITGGFKLNKPPDKIFVLDLIVVFQGPFALCSHTFKNKPCHDIKKCIMKKKMDAIERYIKKELKNISIADLIGGK